jgi:hypothetical protein
MQFRQGWIEGGSDGCAANMLLRLSAVTDPGITQKR